VTRTNELYLLGLGVEPVEHATLEVLQAAGRCDVLFCEGLDETQRAFLARFARKGRVEVLAGSEDSRAKAVGAALAADRTAALVTPGHPYHWSGLAGKLVALAEKKGIAWRTFGAVSPMGLALSISGVTLGTNVHGMQSFDCRALAEKKAAINLAWPLVVYFYDAVDEKTYAAALKRLTAEYGADHPALWCSADGANEASRVGALGAAFKSLRASRVLFLERKIESKSRTGRTDFNPRKRDDKKAPSWVKQ